MVPYFHCIVCAATWSVPLPAWVEGTVGCLFVCLFVCMCVCYHKIAVQGQLFQNPNQLQLKLSSLRQKVVLYRTGKFLQASVPVDLKARKT